MIGKINRYFTLGEKLLWGISALLVIVSFVVFDRHNYLTLCASLTGVTYLILNAKGNPLGQFLVIVFSLLYGIISYSFSYYGEMITYLGMTMPMAVMSLVSWLRNPFKGNRSEVKINSRMTKKEAVFLGVLSLVVTIVFYFILKAFNTANLTMSTLSVMTSFAAVYLTFRRSPYYALAYCANDIVLVVLWIYASMSDMHYISVVVCFSVFFVNDIYSFFAWQKLLKNQQAVLAGECMR